MLMDISYLENLREEINDMPNFLFSLKGCNKKAKLADDAPDHIVDHIGVEVIITASPVWRSCARRFPGTSPPRRFRVDWLTG